jgi:hypothetical protein
MAAAFAAAVVAAPGNRHSMSQAADERSRSPAPRLTPVSKAAMAAAFAAAAPVVPKAAAAPVVPKATAARSRMATTLMEMATTMLEETITRARDQQAVVDVLSHRIVQLEDENARLRANGH